MKTKFSEALRRRLTLFGKVKAHRAGRSHNR
jgi:ribosomal protein L35